MRSHLITSALTIALGISSPIVSAIGFPENAVAQSVEERTSEATKLLIQCSDKHTAKQYKEAFQLCEKSLPIYRSIRDRHRENLTLSLIAIIAIELDEYEKAVKYLELGLAIAREDKDQRTEDNLLLLLASSYTKLRNYPKAIEYAEEALPKARKSKDKSAESALLMLLGTAHNSLTNYTKSLEYGEAALEIARGNQNPEMVALLMIQLGSVYSVLGNYPKALSYAQQSLEISRTFNKPSLEGPSLHNLGVFYFVMGDYPKALEYQQKSLKIVRENNDRSTEAQSLVMTGLTYFRLKEYEKSIENYEKSLAVDLKNIESRPGYLEAITRGNIGSSYRELRNYPKAIDFYRKSLDIALKGKFRDPEAYALLGLGWTYQAMGDYPKALFYHEQVLTIAREMKLLTMEGTAFIRIASVLQDQKKPDLAITYYRQSIQIIESIRKNNLTLSKDVQTSYTQSVSDTYRDFASLLISQGRNAEAQQVLELLKVEDLNDFAAITRSKIASGDNSPSAVNPAVQTEINTLIAFGKTLDDCRRSGCSSLSTLESQYQEQRTTTEKNIQQIEAKAKNNPTIAGRTADFTQSADKLANRPNTAVIYPLVNADGVQLLWMTQGKVNGSATCSMPKAKLDNHIKTFRNLIANPNSDLNVLKAESKVLYDCLIGPLDAAFKANKITNIIFIPNLTTSYIPLAALYDGTNYLIDRYTISNALSAALTNTTDRLPPSASTLGLGLTDAYPGYSALPNVQIELDNIVKTGSTTGIFPGTTFLNTQFTRDTLNGDNQKNLRDRKIVHIATHGEFLPADPKASYLLLGNGDRFPIYQIQDLDALRNTHLVVLSACETGVGGKDNNGTEIAGISSYFLNDRAKAVLASLWKVDDASTSLLMQNFYQNLATGMSKPSALREAQRNLLTEKITTKSATDRGVRLYRPPGATASNFAHPYFWAPFTLTGNPN